MPKPSFPEYLRLKKVNSLKSTIQDKTPQSIRDDARFLKSWLENPFSIGSVKPSGRSLARMMASHVDLTFPGPIVELGPGTGPVTEALLQRGVPPERLILVEFNSDFCQLLRQRFPGINVIQGDAYCLRKTLGNIANEQFSSIVSSLPLFTKPLQQRMTLLEDAFSLMHARAPYIQFTYAVAPPIPKNGRDYSAIPSGRVWWNFPPARVWVYRRDK